MDECKPLIVGNSGGLNDAKLGKVRRCRLTLSNQLCLAAGTKPSKLEYDGPLSNFAFNFKLRRYSKDIDSHDIVVRLNVAPVNGFEAKVGRCQLTEPKPELLKRAWFQRLKLKRDELLSTVAFKFNLRRYTKVGTKTSFRLLNTLWQGLADVARHVIGCRLTQGTRVQKDCEDVVDRKSALFK